MLCDVSSRSSGTFHERLDFFRRNQNAAETVDEYLDEIRRLAKYCEFDAQEELLVRDRFVLGLNDVRLQQKIIANASNPTIVDLIEICETFIENKKELAKAFIHKKKKLKSITPKLAPPQSPLKCNFCDMTFKFASWLRTHTKQHTNERTATCRLCSKSFRNGNGLAKHMITHTDEREIPCPKCGKAFKCDRHLQQHIKWSHDDDKHRTPCSVCHKTFKRPSLLKLHMKSQHTPSTDDRIFECYMCRKQQKSERVLRIHLYEHTRDKHCLCAQCGFRFNSVNKLKKHLMRDDHNPNGESKKMHNCDVCAKRFGNKFVLKNHLRVHTGEKPFRCSCAKAFSTQNNLKQHAVIHSAERPFACHLCDYKSKSKYNLRKHLLIHERNF